MSGCGPPCWALKSQLQYKFHLLVLENEIAKPPRNAGDLYLEARGGRNNEHVKHHNTTVRDQMGDSTAKSLASRTLNNPKIQAALAYHRQDESKAVGATREALARLLLKLAATAEVRTSDLLTVRHRGEVSKEELEALMEATDKERATALRKLLKIDVIPWEGEDAINPNLTRGLGISQMADGSVRFLPPPGRVAVAAIAELSKLFGLHEKSSEAEAIEKLGGDLQAGVARFMEGIERRRRAKE